MRIVLSILFLLCSTAILTVNAQGGSSPQPRERKTKDDQKAPKPPTIEPESNGNTKFDLVENSQYRLSCVAQGVPKPTIKWFHNSEEIDPDDTRFKTNKNNNNQLTINKIKKETVGNYSCEARNDYGVATKQFVVIIGEGSSPPNGRSNAIDRNESELSWGYDQKEYLTESGPAGQELTCDCRPAMMVDAENTHVEWFKKMALFAQNTNITDSVLFSNTFPSGVFRDKFTFVLEKASPRSNTLITCVLKYRSPINGNVSIQRVFDVTVVERIKSRPILLNSNENITGYLGEQANFECSALSDAQPYYSWFRIHEDQNRSQTIKEANEHVSEEEAKFLVIHNLTYDDAGLYECVVANHYGESTKYFRLHVIDRRAVTGHHPGINVVYLGLGIALAAVIVFGLVIFLLARRKLRHRKTLYGTNVSFLNKSMMIMTEKNILYRSTSNGSSTSSSQPLLTGDRSRLSSEKADLPSIPEDKIHPIAVDKELDFPRERLRLGNILGSGAFGLVLKAEAINLNGRPGATTVAVKMVKEHAAGTEDAETGESAASAAEREIDNLMKEIGIMRSVGRHVNILNLLGVCYRNGPLYVIVEYAMYGNLRDFVRIRRPPEYHLAIDPDEMAPLRMCNSDLTDDDLPHPKETDLVKFAYQAARGMEYLASKKCVHRDLAARNVLVANNFVIKIADFGLARDIHIEYYYKKTTEGRLPIKWMAPEALFDRICTTKSDVWSFGVLLWEIVTYGGMPYPSVPVTKLYDYLREGNRMARPENCSTEIYSLMQSCWDSQPAKRPTFSSVVASLDRILSLSLPTKEYLELEGPLDSPVSTDSQYSSLSTSEASARDDLTSQPEQLAARVSTV